LHGLQGAPVERQNLHPLAHAVLLDLLQQQQTLTQMLSQKKMMLRNVPMMMMPLNNI
jgi:hypothetical protein